LLYSRSFDRDESVPASTGWLTTACSRRRRASVAQSARTAAAAEAERYAALPYMELSNGYRRARRTTSWLCAAGLAWSTAQVEIRSVEVSGAGIVDLSTASIPIVLGVGVAYSLVRTTLEYAMQSVPVRQWGLAQADYMLTLTLVRATLLMIAASGLYRSATTMAVVAVGVVAFLLVSAFLMTVAMFAVMPVVMWFRERRGQWSVATASFIASNWAGGIVIVVMVAALALGGVLSVTHEPMRQLWPVPPTAGAMATAVAMASAIVISYVLFEGRSMRYLFSVRSHDAQYG
ncbi:MAG: hypothetical protein Q8L86_15970, partial [Vicinamibacterales bacterium]|nr:hypothetical protein [Vicinamibacterales bacterium]